MARKGKARERLLRAASRLLDLQHWRLALLCYAAGIGMLVTLPQRAPNTYLSENALLPGQARSGFTERHAALASQLARDYHTVYQDGGSVQQWLQQQWLQ